MRSTGAQTWPIKESWQTKFRPDLGLDYVMCGPAFSLSRPSLGVPLDPWPYSRGPRVVWEGGNDIVATLQATWLL